MVRSHARAALNHRVAKMNTSPGVCGMAGESMAMREALANRVAPSPMEYNQEQQYPESPHNTLPNTQPGPMSNATAFRVNMWQSRLDSGVQTMTHSQAPSMMSMTSIHAASHISGVSSMADELARTGLTDQQQQKFEHIPFCQNPDHTKAAQAIPQLIELMNDEDEVVVNNAVHVLQNIAKLESDNSRRNPQVIMGPEVVLALRKVLIERRQSSNIVRVALGALFHMCDRTEALRDVIAVMTDQDCALFKELIGHIGNHKNSCHKYAILTLHSILSAKSLGTESLELARGFGVLRAITQWLDVERSEKLLPVIVDLVRLLCDNNNDQRAAFQQMNGVPKLLFIMDKYAYENLLFRTAGLLKAFSNFCPEVLVQNGANIVLEKKLFHGSPRLVLASLECLRNISDFLSDSDNSPLMTSLLKFIGYENPSVILFCVNILYNMCVKNKHNKEFLVRNNIVHNLIRQMCIPQNFKSEREMRLLEDAHEAILDLLRTLCFGHDLCLQVQVAVLQENPHVFLDKLVAMRPKILKQTLQVLIRVSTHEANLPVFAATKLKRRDGAAVTFVSQILYILQVACNQLSANLTVEDIKVTDLMFLTMSTLQNMCKYPPMLQETVIWLQQPQNVCQTSPQHLLPYFALIQPFANDESVKKAALGFISALVAHPDMAKRFASNEEYMNNLQMFTLSSTLAAHAEEVLRAIGRGGAEFMPSTSRQQFDPRLGSYEQTRPPYPDQQQYRHDYPQHRPQYPPQQHMNSHHHYPGQMEYRVPPTSANYPPPPSYYPPQQTSAYPIQNRNEMYPDYRHPSVPTSGYPSPEQRNSRELIEARREQANHSPADYWPEDLNNVNDPFVNVFCGPNPTNSPQYPQNAAYRPDNSMDTHNAPMHNSPQQMANGAPSSYYSNEMHPLQISTQHPNQQPQFDPYPPRYPDRPGPY